MGVTTAQLFSIVNAQLRKMEEVHQALSGQQLHPLDQQMLKKIDDWVRRIAGAVEGHGAEFELYYQHRFKKRRAMADPRGIADVAIGGPNDEFAKAVQSKSTVQKGHGAIDGYLRDALSQLMGEKGEKPRPNDRPTILITIWDNDNPWPYTSLQNPLPTTGAFKQAVINRVAGEINAYLGQQLATFTFGQQTNPAQTFLNTFYNVGQSTPLFKGVRPTQNAPRPHATPDYFLDQQGWHKIRTLLVKLKWPLRYPCTTVVQQRSVTAYVESLTLVGHRSGNKFYFNVEKEKIYAPAFAVPTDAFKIQNLIN